MQSRLFCYVIYYHCLLFCISAKWSLTFRENVVLFRVFEGNWHNEELLILTVCTIHKEGGVFFIEELPSFHVGNLIRIQRCETIF